MGTAYKTNKKKQEDRDQAILFFLACGVALSEQIRREVFIRDDGKPCLRQISERRLNKLTQMGYLIKRRFKRINQVVTVYALSEMGKDYVAGHFQFERDYIRSGIPNTNKLVHCKLSL